MRKLILIIFLLPILANAQANFQWAKTFGGIYSDEGNSITLDPSGNVYTTGSFEDVVDFDPGTGVYTLTSTIQSAVFITKLDATGNFVWAKNIGGLNSFGDVANSITLDAANNIYITGYFFGIEDFDPGIGTFTLSATTNGDAFICKLDPSGNFIWAKNFNAVSGAAGTGIKIDLAGNVCTTGSFWGLADFDPGPGTYTLVASGTAQSDIFVSKLDASGNFIWAKQMGGAVLAGDESFGITVDALGNIYTTGYFTGTADFDPGLSSYTLTSLGARDIFVSKLDVSGDFVWANQFGSTGNDNAYSIALDASGNVYASGSFTGTVDFDPGAGVYSLTSTVGFSAFTLKLTSSGTFLWVKNFGGGNIAVDLNNNVYATGGFVNTIDFDPGVGSYNLTSAGQADAFISKLDASGNFVWAKQIGGTSTDIGRSIAVDATGNVHVIGSFYNTVDFDPSTSIYSLTSFGQSDIFILKLDNAVGIEEFNPNDYQINIYPNPNTGLVNIISSDFAEGGLLLSLKDVAGKTVYNNTLTVSNGKGAFTVEAGSGIYFLEIIELKTYRKAFKKLIIQK